MPVGSQTISIVPAAEGKLALKVDNTILKDRRDRVNFLKASAGVTMFETRLEDLLPSPKKRVRDGITGAELVLITSQEIDELCEGDNVPLARRTMDDMLLELQRAFRKLGEMGINNIVISADHGYLFGEELGDDMKIDAPGGKTSDLHRRVWVGQGGASNSAFLRANLSDFGFGGDLEIATPWNLACFKVKGGAKAYFHGGLSPQEIIIPLITLKLKKTSGGTDSGVINWTIQPGSKKISTHFFSVTISGGAGDLLPLVAPQVHVEIRTGDKVISHPVSASYGYEDATGHLQLHPSKGDSQKIEPDTITFQLDETKEKFAEIYLLDATSGVELAHLKNIEVVITI